MFIELLIDTEVQWNALSSLSLWIFFGGDARVLEVMVSDGRCYVISHFDSGISHWLRGVRMLE